MKSEADKTSLNEEMEKYESEHIKILRRIVPECMVLLKYDGKFPLDRAEKIALYGNGARHTKKGGTGSGDVNVRSFVTIEQGLINACFEITTSYWLDAYDKEIMKAEENHKNVLRERIKEGGIAALLSSMGEATPEPEYEIPIRYECETAIYVLSRQSGEGTDRQEIKGDFLLTDTEKRDILEIAELYSRFILVLNTAGVIDISPVIGKVPNILLLSHPGMTAGDSFADVLTGISYPSGKLTATWAKLKDYPDAGTYRSIDDTYYKEGIFVGYRWFDSFHKKLLFPFGYGLGYTDFTVGFVKAGIHENTVTIDASVVNIGNYRGRECVQLYIKKPAGKLIQAEKDLVGYAKTKELKPQEKEILSICFDITDLSSFDSDIHCSILEKGDYIIYAGTSSNEIFPCAIIRLIETVITETLHNAGGTPLFLDICPDVSDAQKDDLSLPVLDLKFVKEEKKRANYNGNIETADFLALEEQVAVCVGKCKSGSDESIIGDSNFSVAGAAGETSGVLERYGFRSIVFADGPAGIRIAKTYEVTEKGIHSLDNEGIDKLRSLLPPSMVEMLGDNRPIGGEIHHQYTSAIPVGTALAQSFDPDLEKICGEIVGEEMELYGIDIWLAPAVNIQRDPLCGRNFEYYSEDPFVSGKAASAVISGVQSRKGKGAALKHCCCNNQETNRFRSNSVVSQRALRDIYLKGFEIAVKEARPACVMTSYNLLNGIHTAERADLLKLILREEWGFDGVVISDWIVSGIKTNTDPKMHKKQSAIASLLAGNDLIMPGSKEDYDKILKEAYDDLELRKALLVSSSRIIRMVSKLMESI